MLNTMSGKYPNFHLRIPCDDFGQLISIAMTAMLTWHGRNRYICLFVIYFCITSSVHESTVAMCSVWNVCVRFGGGRCGCEWRRVVTFDLYLVISF